MVIAIATSSWRSVTSPAAATRTRPLAVRGVGAAPEVRQVVGEVGHDLEQQRDQHAAERRVQRGTARPTASPAPRPTATPATAAGSVCGRAAWTQIERVDGRGPERGARRRREAIGHQGRRGYLR